MTNTAGGTTNPSDNSEVIAAELEAFKRKYEGTDKRLRDTQSYSARQLNEKDSEIERLNKRLSELEQTQLPQEEGDLLALKKENPRLYNAVMTAAAKASVSERGNFKKEFENLNKLMSKKNEAETFRQVLFVHSDADEIRRSADFSDWLMKQSNLVQKAFSGKEEADADDFILYIDKFKRDTKYKNPNATRASNKKKQADDSIGISSKSNSVPDEDDGEYIKESDIKNMADADWIKNRDKIQKMANEGKIILGA